jgi:hypothetical protein
VVLSSASTRGARDGPQGLASRGWALSLDNTPEFVAVESCLVLEALAQVLRQQDDRVVAGAISCAHSARGKVSAANPDVVLFDFTTVALSGPAWFHAWQAGRTAKVLWSAWEKRMRPLFLRALGEGVVGSIGARVGHRDRSRDPRGGSRQGGLPTSILAVPVPVVLRGIFMGAQPP